MANIQFIVSESELGAGTRGSSLGFRAIEMASIEENNYLFNNINHIPYDKNLLAKPIKFKNAIHIKGIEVVHENLSKRIEEAYIKKAFPILITGDHSNAAGTIAGVKKAFPNKKLGVIWIDAHADIHSPYTSPSGNIHGMPLAICIAEDNMECKANEPHEEVIRHWNNLKRLNNQQPKIQSEDVIIVGLRDYEKPEEHLIKTKNISVLTVYDVQEKGVAKAADEALNLLSDCDLIHISFDIDSLDKSFVPGTGTPVDNGFTEKEATGFILQLLHSSKISSFEITEVNPLLDHCNQTGKIAYRIINAAKNIIEKNTYNVNNE